MQCIDNVFNSDVEAIGIGVPGILDKKEGVIYDMANIPSWKELNLKKALEDKFNVSVYIDNDANCFARGESIFGKAQGIENVVGLTLGTGMGAGVIINNKLHSGLLCGAGELGEVPYLSANYEKYCSGQYFRDLYNTDGESEFENAENGSLESIELYKGFAKHLAKAIELATLCYAPDLVVLGGSVSKSRKYFEEELRKLLSENGFRNNPEIEFSEINNSALFGAASLCY